MSPRYIRSILLSLFFVALVLPGLFCDSPNEEDISSEVYDSRWHSVYDTTVRYVGMEKCRTCHEGIYQTYIQTGMGQSYGHATRQKSAAEFSQHAVVYDKHFDFYYKPYWQNDSLYILEYRTKNGDTIHSRRQKIDYIIGSGQHTNSHIFGVNGYLYQAPITFYTQKGKWDLAPGFEDGANTRFSRVIQSECMTCHNGYPQMVPGSENKYLTVKTGIDCERCHGPGSLHVAEKMAGNIVDTSKGPDYTIVNPRRLSTELQNNICQRCHLQGIAVLNDGKDFFDFRPGMRLSEVMNVFMPQYEGARDKMIMASHVERMKKSPCYINSGKLSCITCHDPHISVDQTPLIQFANACKSCHGGAEQVHCTEDRALRAAKNDNCISCHMPQNSSIDIPHVAVTDHYIRRRPLLDTLEDKITAFLGLKSFNNDNVEPITMARAYMEFFERYNPNAGLIDSALYYLSLQKEKEEKEKQNRDYIRAYFLLKDFGKVMQYASAVKPEQINDAWAAYRCGEAYFLSGKYRQALGWYARAVAILPKSLDFQSKYGTCLLTLGNIDAARKVFAFIVSEHPNYTTANTNLGYIYMQQSNPTMAYEFLSRAIEADPDHEQALINIAVWYHQDGQYDKVKQSLMHLLSKHPQNTQAKLMLLDLE